MSMCDGVEEARAIAKFCAAAHRPGAALVPNADMEGHTHMHRLTMCTEGRLDDWRVMSSKNLGRSSELHHHLLQHYVL